MADSHFTQQTTPPTTPPALSGAVVFQSAAQTLTVSTYTVINFDSEEQDTDNYHNNITNNSRFTIPSAGTYLITACAPTSVNTTYRGKFRVNGTTDLAPTGAGNAGASSDNGPSISTVKYFNAGDYVEFMVAYLSASGNTIAGASGTRFTIHKLG